MGKMARKKANKIHDVIAKAFLLLSIIILFAITIETSRYVLTQGEYKPFYLKSIQNKDIGIKVSELKSKYKGKFKEVEPLFNDIKHERAIPQLNLEQSAILYASGKALFIDARGESEYRNGHIKGAIWMPLNKPEEFIKNNKSKFKNKILITYCHGVGCRLSNKAANQLYLKGYKKVGIFFGGWNHWKEANYPITISE